MIGIKKVERRNAYRYIVGTCYSVFDRENPCPAARLMVSTASNIVHISWDR